MLNLLKAPLVLGVAFASLLSSCGPESTYSVTADESRATTINRALLPYFQEFVHYYGKETVQLPLHIGALEKGVAGKCYVPGGRSAGDQIADSVFGDSTQKERRILINAAWYERNKDNHEAIQNVVFHELGHCILNRGHSKEMMTDQYGQEIPASIMYPSEFGEKPFYQQNFKAYLKELFNPKPGSATVSGNSSGSHESPDDGASEPVALY